MNRFWILYAALLLHGATPSAQAGFFRNCGQWLLSLLPQDNFMANQPDRAGQYWNYIFNQATSDAATELDPAHLFTRTSFYEAAWVERDPQWEGFGVERTTERMVRLHPGFATRWSNWTDHTREVLRKRLEAEPIEIPFGNAWTISGCLTNCRGIVRTYYTPLFNGSPLLAGLVLVQDDGEPDWWVSPSPESIAPILRDVGIRLQSAARIPKDPARLEEKKRLFSEALYGYVQAHPYKNGVFVIGEAIFSGFFYGLFGHDPEAWPTPEFLTESMALSQREFVGRVLPYWRSTRERKL